MLLDPTEEALCTQKHDTLGLWKGLQSSPPGPAVDEENKAQEDET
jgi:hypothetical protein